MFLCAAPAWAPGHESSSELRFFANCQFPPSTALSPTGGDLSRSSCVVDDVLESLKAANDKEFEKYVMQNAAYPKHKEAARHLYSDPASYSECRSALLRYARRLPAGSVSELPYAKLRLLFGLTHLIIEDTRDCGADRQDAVRRHCDVFEGHVLPGGVNTQLVKDANRSEFAVGGKYFSLSSALEKNRFLNEEQRRVFVAEFQRAIVVAIERFVLSFAKHHQLSQEHTLTLMKAVTTQMCQAGLGNLERACEDCRKYFPSQPKQRTFFTLTETSARDALVMTIMVTKSEFELVHTEETSGEMRPPIRVRPSSFLSLSATVQFMPDPHDCDGPIVITVTDARDEVRIDPIT
mmetsp:Transcript_2326/g.5145  ORF Transcript_2326/g.5145 Transcript_2326/m.5145 type:complete len:350 (+) Transcript_2326:91-1140(+)